MTIIDRPAYTTKICAVEALEMAFDELEQCDLRELDAEDDTIEPEIPELGDQTAILAIDVF